jgi:hypothetical protein
VRGCHLASSALRWSSRVVEHDTWNFGCILGHDNCPKEPSPGYGMGSGTMPVKGAQLRDRVQPLQLEPRRTARVSGLTA